MSAGDERLQQQIENNQFHEMRGVDADVYKMVFSALKHKPSYELSPSFSDRVVQQIVARRLKEEARRDTWFFIVMLTLLIGGALIAVTFISKYVDVKLSPEAFSGLRQYSGIIILSAFMLILFTWVDKKFIRTGQVY